MKEKSNSNNDIKQKINLLSKNLNKNYYEILTIYQKLIVEHYYKKLSS